MNDNGANQNVVLNNKYNLLATSNIIDNLEKVSTVVEEAGGGDTGHNLNLNKVTSKSGVEGSLAINNRADHFNISPIDFVVSFMGTNGSQKLGGDVLNKDIEIERCQLNSEVDVDSDLDETGLFMAGDDSLREFQRVGSDFKIGEEDKDQAAFAVEQIFGGSREIGNRSGSSKHGFNE